MSFDFHVKPTPSTYLCFCPVGGALAGGVKVFLQIAGVLVALVTLHFSPVINLNTVGRVLILA